MPDEPQPEPVDAEIVELSPAPGSTAQPAGAGGTPQPAEAVTTPQPAGAGGATQPVETGYTPDGVPTFESVREKIETRYGTAIGAAELASETPEGRSVEEQYEARQKAAAERLARIRESMNRPDGSG
ncbi:hypothetical protein FIV07_13955 [Mycobacterium sp. THAF192]|nr:hypothetical protein FIV07_13955 [Mycobacterium sp. THAF192]